MVIDPLTNLRLRRYTHTVLSQYGFSENARPNLWHFSKQNGIEISYADFPQRTLGKFIHKDKENPHRIILRNLRPPIRRVDITRQHFTLAHELAHWVIAKHPQEFFRALNRTSIPSAHLEKAVDILAAEILIPEKQLRRTVKQQSAAHPMAVLSILCSEREFNVNPEPMLSRLVHTSITKELPWFIGLFEFRKAPNKSPSAENIEKWRLKPNYLVLPRGIGKARRWNYLSMTYYGDPGYRWCGLDTLRIAPAQYAVSSKVTGLTFFFANNNLYNLFLSKTVAPINFDLNELSKKGKILANRIGLSPKRILEEKKYNEIPVASALLESQFRHPHRQWTNGNWRLFVHDLQYKCWAIPETKEYKKLLIAGFIGLAPR